MTCTVLYTVEGAAAAGSGLLDVPVSKTGPSALDMSDVANSLATIQQGNVVPLNDQQNYFYGEYADTQLIIMLLILLTSSFQMSYFCPISTDGRTE